MSREPHGRDYDREVRIGALALAAFLLAAGWAFGSLKPTSSSASLVTGTSDYGPGNVRVSFLILKASGEPAYRPTAQVKAADGASATAVLETVGTSPETSIRLYVVHLRIARAGSYSLSATPQGTNVTAVGSVDVKEHSATPAIGSRAPASNTPTIASAHGKLSVLTTRVPPDRSLLRYSVAESLAAHKPFVVVFASPKFCTTRTCGPVVDVTEAVAKRFAAVRFIHVEVYEHNDPAKGTNEWVRQWHLPSETWAFLVGGDGRIRAKLEGSFSTGELAAAVTRYLAP